MIHRGFTIIGIAATLALAGGLTASAGATGSATECNGSYSNTTFNGGVVVKSGDTCTLNNVVIDGGLTVTGGTIQMDNSLVHGTWDITGGTGNGNPQCGNKVDGGLRIENVTDSFGGYTIGEKDLNCAGGTIDGGVRFVNNTNTTLELDGYHVNGGLVDTGNTGEWNEIESDTVNGPGTCANNDAVHGGTSAPTNDGDGGLNTFTGPNNGCPTTNS